MILVFSFSNPFSRFFATLDLYHQQRALEMIVGKKVNIVIAGRTDSGVHAIENIAHVDISRVAKSPKHPIVRLTYLLAEPISFYTFTRL